MNSAKASCSSRLRVLLSKVQVEQLIINAFINPKDLLKASNISKISEDISVERKNQSKLLDTLIYMDYEGYIFLNSDTDESVITIKGLIKINNKIFWN